MKKTAVLACLLTAALLVIGCGDDQTPILGVGNPATDLEQVRPPHAGLKKNAYYSFAGSATTGLPYSELNRISTKTGEGTYRWTLDVEVVGDWVTFESFGWIQTGLTFDVDGTMYITQNILGLNPDLVRTRIARVDTRTGEVTPITDEVPFNTSGPDIDANGSLFVCGFETDLPYVWGNPNLYRVDTATGLFDEVGPTGYSNWMDLAFDSQGTLWATKENELWTIDPETGSSAPVTDIMGVPEPFEVMSIAFDKHDVLYGTAMLANYTPPDGCPVMKINVTTGVATVVGYTHQLNNHGGDFLLVDEDDQGEDD